MRSFPEIQTEIWWAVFLTIFGIIVPVVWSGFQRRKIRQADIFHREAHNLQLFRALSDENQRVQMAAAAVLVQRLRQKATRPFEIAERDAIIRALLSVTKDLSASKDGKGTSPELSKFIADNVPKELGAFAGSRTRLQPRSPLKDYDWQGAFLGRAWWAGIDAREVDFFGAHLDAVGMRNAHLSGAVFMEASLRGSVLAGADLTGADLRGADLRGANLDGAELTEAKLADAIYDARTKLPKDFDARSAGMVERTQQELAKEA